MDKMWLVYAVLAGLCWGTYVPLVQQGIAGLRGNSLGSFLCVGVAYFLIAVLIPVTMFLMGERTPAWNAYGITFATLAGVAGALGALFVIFANRNANQLMSQAVEAGLEPVNYRLFIPPVIFALAPLLNTLVSLFWHPSPSAGAFEFGIKHLPGWKFYLGILLTAAGAFLVLYSKEETEQAEKKPVAPAPTTVHVAPTPPSA
jgi:drug/metabolite transporter (DMT)-like permease